MKKVFITYGDDKFTLAKKRILKEALKVGWFDTVKSYGPQDVSESLKSSGLMDIPRGGGLWSWKPDIILQALENVSMGDIVVYADSGCSLQISKEWNHIENILSERDLIAQRLYQPTYKWTRREVLDLFSSNSRGWKYDMQFCATVVIVKKTIFSLKFIREWRDTIINYPQLIKDVSSKEKPTQHEGFYENRHDQSIYSALVYKYIPRGTIYTQWEHIEDYDPFLRQAVRATRLRNGEKEKKIYIPIKILKCYYKKFWLRSLYRLKSIMGYKK